MKKLFSSDIMKFIILCGLLFGMLVFVGYSWQFLGLRGFAAEAVTGIAIMLLAGYSLYKLFGANGEQIRGKIAHGLKSTSMNSWAIWAAIFLSISSLATTYLGMQNFHVHWIFAFVSSLGIQILLFVSSWIFAEASANRSHAKRLRREGDENSTRYKQAMAKADGFKFIMASFMVIASMGVSVFFSLDSLFDTVYLPENRELTNVKVARSDMGGVFDKLRDKVDETNQEKLIELTDSDAWDDWNRNLDVIMTAAGNAKDQISLAIQIERGAAEAALEKAIRDANATGKVVADLIGRQQSLASGQGADTQGDRFQQQLATKEREIGQVQNTLSALEAEFADWEIRINEEINAGGTNEDGSRRETGCGPVCRDYQREQLAVKARLDGRKAQLSRLTDDLARIRSQGEDALSAIQRVDSELKTAEAADEAAKAALSAARLNHETIFKSADAGGTTGQATGAVNAIRSGISEFLATASVSALQPAISSCQIVYETMNANPVTRDGISNVSCDITSIAPTLETMARYEDAEKRLSEECRVDDEFIQFNTVRPMIDKARRCISISGLPYVAIKEERDLADRVEQENSENSSRFEITLSTLRRGDSLSWLTLFIAFSIDLFVLGSAVVGARTMESVLEEDGEVGSRAGLDRIELLQFAHAEERMTDPPNIRTQKQFLSVLEHDAYDYGEENESILDLEGARVSTLDNAAVKTLNLQMSSLVAQELAFPITGRSGCYRIKANYVSHITFQVAQYERDYHARNAAASSNDDYPSGQSDAMQQRSTSSHDTSSTYNRGANPRSARGSRGRWEGIFGDSRKHQEPPDDEPKMKGSFKTPFQ
ncbi:MAG: hypothetical protein AAF423_01230 [Pseudomonadota bacterium]